MKLARFALTAVGLMACHALAHAESLASFDTFAGKGLDSARWVEADLDTVRTVVDGRAVLGKRSLGNSVSDAGGLFDTQSLTFANGDLITALAAEVTVDSLATTACGANALPAAAKLRLGGAFFNVGTPTAGSALGDVVAQVMWSRTSDSTDAANQMRLTASVLRCTNADCSTQKLMGSAVDLGLAEVGRKVRLLMRWNPTAKAFTFRRDAGLTQAVTYLDDDTTPATKPAKSFSVRNVAPNCASGERGEAALKVRIDNVSVNSAALP